MELVNIFYITAILFFVVFLVLTTVVAVSLLRVLKTIHSILENVDEGMTTLKMGSKAFQSGLAKAAWNFKKYFEGRRRRR